MALSLSRLGHRLSLLAVLKTSVYIFLRFSVAELHPVTVSAGIILLPFQTHAFFSPVMITKGADTIPKSFILILFCGFLISETNDRTYLSTGL
jgi:hypothetical protein